MTTDLDLLHDHNKGISLPSSTYSVIIDSTVLQTKVCLNGVIARNNVEVTTTTATIQQKNN